MNKCECEDWGLERGDTLYYCTSDDVGIMYNYIQGIQFCPKCGKALLTYKERMKQIRASRKAGEVE